MSSPNSVIRRYTPPTCTLEIAAKDSPLSRWMGQSVLKHLRFKLSFDDPRVSEDQWITVRGDRNQLQSLCDAVSHYVQNFLSQSNRLESGSNGTTVIQQPVTDFIPQTEQNSAGIHLQPKGLISHELHLGTLANESTGAMLQLSAVQLADLASALDEYAADVTALPNLEKPRWLQSTPGWGTIAAGAIAAIGIGVPLTLKMMEPTPVSQTAQAPSSGDQRLPVQPLPNTPAPNTIGSLPTSPLPLPSGAPNATTTAPPNLNPGTLPNQTDQSPQLKISQDPPVDAPAPQQQEVQIQTGTPQVQEVPVAGIQDQTKKPAAKNPGNAVTRPVNPDEDPNPPANTGDVAIASRSAESADAITAPTTLGRSAAPAPAVAIPQTNEAAQALQKTWKPPAGLKSGIEYFVIVNGDGTVNSIQPLGEDAKKFVENTGIPLVGEKLVSPIQGRNKAVFRVLFKPDGTVQAFLQ